MVRRFIYRYDGYEGTQEFEDDPTGAREIPVVGTILERLGRSYKVTTVYAPVGTSGSTPVVRVFLSSRF